MELPENDLERRRIVWEAMHVLFLDTDVDAIYLDEAAQKCARTKYSLNHLKQIFWNEVYPGMRWNIWDIAGEWSPIDIDILSEVILERHKFAKQIRFRNLRSYPSVYWQKLELKIRELRSSQPTSQ